MNERPNRKKLRYRSYDYASQGAYMVTICTHGRKCLFGRVAQGRCQLSLFGQMVKQTLEALTGQMKMSLTDCVVMPNHLHFIVMIEEAAAPGDKRASVIDLVRDLKSLTTRAYIQLVKEGQCLPFDGKIWQRSFYDSIIDSYEQYVNASYYIETNPQNWHADIYHT